MKTMGIIAGNGRFPILVAEEAKRAGFRVVTCAIEQEADPAMEKLSDAFHQYLHPGERGMAYATGVLSQTMWGVDTPVPASVTDTSI